MWIIFLYFLPFLGAYSACPALVPPRRGSVICYVGKKPVSCGSYLPPGSFARYRCLPFYELRGTSSRSCQSDSSWSSPAPECVPDCGRRSAVSALVVNGVVATPGAFPWHVAIYNLLGKRFEYWCGGSLISEIAVLTAAHCTWQISPKHLMLAFGKFNRNFDFEENHVKNIKAKRIKILMSYQDVGGNYNGDLALIFLEKPVEFNDFIKPVCIDWNQRFVDQHLSEGSLGMVPGWGLTENETFSDFLRVIQMPVRSDEKCIAEQQTDFKKFVTYTSFCAGLKNGTGVCNGDSGGGIVFADVASDRWYLQGLVSVSPRRKGTSYCDPNFYTVFTKVSVFAKWLADKLGFEEKNMKQISSGEEKTEPPNKIEKDIYGYIRKYFEKSKYEKNDVKLEFPHSDQILHSAGIKLN